MDLLDIDLPRPTLPSKESPSPRQRFEQLVQRFETQLLHGCTNAECTTPTCRSGLQHTQKWKPFRPYTPLSAQIQAHYLAAEPDPQRYLCPNPLKEVPAGPPPVLVPVDPTSLSQVIFSRRATKPSASVPTSTPPITINGDEEVFSLPARESSTSIPKLSHATASDGDEERMLWDTFFKTWNRKAVVPKSSTVETLILRLNRIVFLKRQEENVGRYKRVYLDKYLDPQKELEDYLRRASAPASVNFHLYEHPWLFSDDYLVECFRTANLLRMLRHRQRLVSWNDQGDKLQYYVSLVNGHGIQNWQTQFNISTCREHILENTFDQLRNLSVEELLLPLKVSLGGCIGEIGQDEGGVSNEFFQLFLSSVLSNDGKCSLVYPDRLVGS